MRLLWLAFFGIVGCASTAHRPHACEESMNKSYGLGWAYYLMGTVFQQGNCAAVETLRIEFGENYNQNKDRIFADLDKSPSRDFGSIHSLSKVFNCNAEGSPRFVESVVKRQNDIFGANREKGGRHVMKALESIIEGDPFLKENCNP